MSLEWLGIQLLGGVAALLGVLAFQCRHDIRMLVMLSGSCLVWSLHFLLLAQPTAALLNVITAVRNLVGIRCRGAWFASGFIGLYLVTGSYSWQSVWDILPVVAVISGSVGVFFLAGLPRRGALLIGSLLWLVFNWQAGSIPGVLVMFADGVSNSWRIYRLRRQAQRSELSDRG
ncbi:inner membrane protein [Franzmannia pantelleriensis]|uniref:Inner membrane protein n=1 Tax=Franzmannia pantelleriensis TaxID=48727 RepID=A0A1G9S349_9GAMM|nr:YgjV family protein [Halomonas pantelleriensis]SDM29710.1 inner membrane protein [Halomonas pantelleriensis]